MLNKTVKKVKDLIKVHLDARKNERYMDFHYGNEMRARTTRKLKEFDKEEVKRKVKEAYHKKSKKAYYYPDPVPDRMEEIKANTKIRMDMHARNEALQKKHPKTQYYGTFDQRGWPGP